MCSCITKNRLLKLDSWKSSIRINYQKEKEKELNKKLEKMQSTEEPIIENTKTPSLKERKKLNNKSKLRKTETSEFLTILKPAYEEATLIMASKPGFKKVSIHDFFVEKCLGKGAFGKVLLVKYNKTEKSKLYAMKVIKKADIVYNKLEKSIVNIKLIY